jgi:NADH-quinone oxidoreductase subunit N
MVCSTHLISFYLALEVLNISLYAMIAYNRSSSLGVEAAVKYLLLAAGSSAFLLFGMALIYAELGSLELSILRSATQAQAGNSILLIGFAMVLSGIGFKLSIAPFHMWAPDVYEGAPLPVTALIATISKGATYAVVLRNFSGMDSDVFKTILQAFALLAVASMFTGALLSLRQLNAKRLLAYSSVAHMGYLGIAFLAPREDALFAGVLYFSIYFVTALGLFACLCLMSARKKGPDAANFEDFHGLLWREPVLGSMMILFLLSLAGIPLTAGFIGKFYLIWVGVHSSSWLLLGALVASSAIGLYAYLRLVAQICTRQSGADFALKNSLVHPVKEWLVIGVLALLLVVLGVYPSPLLSTINALLTSAN